jgi:hypothetical protein
MIYFALFKCNFPYHKGPYTVVELIEFFLYNDLFIHNQMKYLSIEY